MEAIKYMIAAFALLLTYVGGSTAVLAEEATPTAPGIFQSDSTKLTTGKQVKKTRRQRNHWGGYFFISEYYDNNVLDYSKKARDEFDTSTAENQRFAISDLSDFVTDIGVRLDRSFEIGKRSEVRARIRYDANLYANNSFRNYNQIGTEIRFSMRRSYAELSGRWIPKYNLRNLYWRPMPQRPAGVRYAAADFSRLGIVLEAGSRIGKIVECRITSELRKNDYDFPLDERDNTAMRLELKLTGHVRDQIELYLRLFVAKTNAAGRDSASANVNDISYSERGIAVGTRYSLDRKEHVIADASVGYHRERYTSSKTADTSHHLRVDKEWDWDFGLAWRVQRHLQPEVFYSYRTSSSTVPVGVTEFGSFSGYRLGLQMTYFL